MMDHNNDITGDGILVEHDQDSSFEENILLANKRRKVDSSTTGQVVVNFDKNLIPKSEDQTLDLAFDNNSSELKALNIVSYKHSVYEQNVIDQVKKNLDKFEKQHRNNDDANDIKDYSAQRQIGSDESIYQTSLDETIDMNIQSRTETDLLDKNQKDREEKNIQYDKVDGPSYIDNFEDCFDDDIDRFLEAPGSCYLESVRKKSTKLQSKCNQDVSKKQILDDGDVYLFKKRIAVYKMMRSELQHDEDEEENELHRIDNDFYIPRRIWYLLYEYQQEALKWLWQLHTNLCGGILGDEMGLGKTVQIITFLVALSFSQFQQVGEFYKKLGPVLLVCPATVMFQWVYEFHKWWPPFRVAILHQSGSYKGTNRCNLIKDIFATNGILITSYNGVATYHKRLVKLNWHYIILDEGHKIRNPDAQITHYCKLFETPHRLILSGTPIQNDLRELWSLMDFVYPSKLGTLNTFMTNVAWPIKQGGYSHASEKEIKISYKCSVMLRDVIKPYLLRRTKDDIQNSLTLPPKNEQVLFCKLTDVQKQYYQEYINSDTFSRIDFEKSLIFKALVNIRKICNHPYLFSKDCNPERKFDKEFYHKSSKIVVVNALLKLWFKQNHKVLIFTQGRQMLDLIEKWIIKKNYNYYRMDGTTSIKIRQNLIKSFNEDPNKFLFLLTTRVGGVGVSLIGANRVIIFDPDWNPCTDIQARERCWRIGQQNDVIIYRLLTSGTIEEKIYHRQIFKQYLCNRILKDPQHKRFVKMNNLRELFTLSDCSETGLYFYDSKVKLNKRENNKKFTEIQQKSKNSNMKNLPKIPKKTVETSDQDLNNNKKNISNNGNKSNLINWSNVEIKISDERRKELREQVKKICQNFNSPSKSSSDESYNVDVKKHNESQFEKTSKADVNYVIDNKPGTSGLKVKILSKKSDENRSDDGKFEGHRIKYLIKKEIYDDGKGCNSSEITSKKIKSEDYLLGKLLGNSIETVLQHDKIENVKIPDHYYIDKEAKDFATKALKDLQEELLYRRQRLIAENEQNAIPQVSSSNRSNVNSKLNDILKFKTNANAIVDPLSGSNIIEGLLNKFNYNCSKSTNSSSNITMNMSISSSSLVSTSSSSRHLENMELMHSLHQFISDRTKNGGKVSTTNIVDEFRNRIRPEQSAIMKALLQHMATIEKSDTNRKETFWNLKPEYKL